MWLLLRIRTLISPTAAAAVRPPPGSTVLLYGARKVGRRGGLHTQQALRSRRLLFQSQQAFGARAYNGIQAKNSSTLLSQTFLNRRSNSPSAPSEDQTDGRRAHGYGCLASDWPAVVALPSRRDLVAVICPHMPETGG